MNIVVYSRIAAGGFGDLFFGKKLVDFLLKKYPGSRVILLTNGTCDGNYSELINKFNTSGTIKALSLDLYQNQNFSKEKIDLLIVGPATAVSADEIVSSLSLSKHTPILILAEYDFGYESVQALVGEFKELGCSNVVGYETGLKRDSLGIFLDDNLCHYDKNNPAEKIKTFNSLSPAIRETILNGMSVEEYLQGNEIYLSYTANNVERFMATQIAFLKEGSSKNVDVIILGMKHQHEKITLTLRMQISNIIRKKFGQIVYQTSRFSSLIFARNFSEEKVYRVIYQEFLAHDDLLNLRKLAADFSAATGDQSYCEAISTNNIVVYDCRRWKFGFAEGMKQIARTVDPTQPIVNVISLERAVHLLAYAANQAEYDELAKLLKNEKIANSWFHYRQTIYRHKNLSTNLSALLDKLGIGGYGFYNYARGWMSQINFTPTIFRRFF
jgi:hypothetical protein